MKVTKLSDRHPPTKGGKRGHLWPALREISEAGEPGWFRIDLDVPMKVGSIRSNTTIWRKEKGCRFTVAAKGIKDSELVDSITVYFWGEDER